MSFVEFFDCPQVAPPYRFPDVTLHLFGIKADPVTLQHWCDKALNLVPEHRFQVLSSQVLLSISDYPRMYLEGFEDLGYSEQAEYALMFPVVRFDNIFGLLVPVDVTWATPFIGVDLPTSSLAGQMVLGYPKLSGRITATTSGDGDFSAVVEMPGMPGVAANPEDDKQALLTVIEAKTGTPLVGGAGGNGFPSELLMGKNHPDFGVLELLQNLDPGLFSLTNLKQVRDPEFPSEPAYQALVRAEWQQAKVHNFTAYDGGMVSITDNNTVQIARTLGLLGDDGANTITLNATFATSVQCDLRFGNPTTVVQIV